MKFPLIVLLLEEAAARIKIAPPRLAELLIKSPSIVLSLALL